ncbi:D-alanine--D-alanine ligase family protein [Streptomyces hoynatensis]|uniref:ATP-grasp domain-containing protein n=1 Tax=Streptomyces hoynatensis TaxID=1141874 RepID=A0A3A9YPC7_9ACTN|nr:hypothetical protein [Streptomyces hoynatensis]RKN37007.1 hypothetical protein D7294_29245 [Streptomyces hoynatensis]
MAERITLLVGGRSTEHDASLHGYRHVLSRLLAEPDRIEVGAVCYVDRAGAFHLFERAPWPEREEVLLGGQTLGPGAALERLRAADSFVFSLLHGNEGEDGGWQGLAEVCGITGNFGPVLASALAMDKHLQAVLAAALLPGLRVPRSLLVRPGSFDAGQVLRRLGPGPLVVKPNRMGASLLTTCLPEPSPSALAAAVREVFPYDDQALVQEFIDGREFSCGVYKEHGKFVDLPVAEIVSSGFFGHAEKHTKGRAKILLSPENAATRKMRAFSQSLFEATEMATFARFDYIVEGDGIWFLEANTLPGLMSGSIFPMMLAETGRSIADLVLSAVSECGSRPARDKVLAYDISH